MSTAKPNQKIIHILNAYIFAITVNT